MTDDVAGDAGLADETEAEVLEDLRGYSGWPVDLDTLAKQAAVIGQLREARDQAMARTFPDAQPSSISSNTIAPARVPVHYSYLPNWEATFYTLLKQELLRVLGLAIPFAPYGDTG